MNANQSVTFCMLVNSVPLKSAIVAKLYIESKVSNQAVPGSITEQADWWKANYNINGATSHFIRTVENYENINSK